MSHHVRTVCSRCGAHASIVRHRAGSVLLEIILWLALVTPGFIYHMWRHRRNYFYCRECGHRARTFTGIARVHRQM